MALTATMALAANPAALDTSFSGDGTRKLGFGFPPHDDGANDVVTTPAGKVIAVGIALQSQSNPSFSVARLTEAGRPDPGFGGDGRRVIDFGAQAGQAYDEAHGVARQSDGRIVLVGHAQTAPSEYKFAVARLTSTGQLDPTFSGNGKLMTGFGGDDDEAHAVVIGPNGKIVVAGFSYLGNVSRFAVARYLPDGGLDHSFSGDGKRTFQFPGMTVSEAVALAVDRNGRLILAGQAEPGDNIHAFAVARLLPGGGLDQSFSNDGRRLIPFGDANDISGARGVALDGAGRIVLAGYVIPGGGDSLIAVTRLRPGGGLDQTFSGNGKLLDQPGATYADARDVVLQANGKIIVAGASNPSAPDDEDILLIRYRANGTRDPSFSGNGVRFTAIESNSDAQAEGIVIDRDGRLVVAGRIFDDGGSTSYVLARYRGGP